MTKLYFPDSFFETAGRISSPKLQNRLKNLLELMEEIPTFGSSSCSDYIKEKYGPNCLVADLSPFLLIFEYTRETDEVVVYGIIHQRQIEY